MGDSPEKKNDSILFGDANYSIRFSTGHFSLLTLNELSCEARNLTIAVLVTTSFKH